MQQKKRRPPRVTGPCPYCESGKGPSYKNYKDLANYMSARARVLGKSRTGICTRHQKRMTKEIKRARHLGLLPFAPAI